MRRDGVYRDVCVRVRVAVGLFFLCVCRLHQFASSSVFAVHSYPTLDSAPLLII